MSPRISRPAPTVGPASGSNSLANLTASEYLDLLRAGDVSVLDYATACAEVIDLLEDELRVWAWYRRGLFEENARRADDALTDWRDNGAAPGTLPGNLTGVPVGVKDIFNTDDMPTHHGSDIFAGYTPGNDARVVTNLRREGGIVAGKTVTAEFAVHHPGVTRNPYDPSRSCGTSSSGSAVAVATGMAPLALASQTGGSTIRPASYCGIYGFKPSYGLLPRTAMLKTTDTFDTIGLMARSVPDLELMFENMRVRGPNYPISDAAMNDPARRSIGGRPWRVAVLEGPKSDIESAAAKDGIRRLADLLADNGCAVEGYRLPPDFDLAHDVHETIYRRALAYYFRMEWDVDEMKFSPGLAEMIESGRRIPFETYLKALAEQTRLARLFDAEAKRFDAVLCPSTSDEAPVGLDTPDPPDHCLIFTMCYAPAISVPVLRGGGGLPIGAQIASRRFNDYLLLRFADLLSEVAGVGDPPHLDGPAAGSPPRPEAQPER